MFGESTSESPRLPSPWDSHLSTPTGSKTPVSYTATRNYQQHSLIPEEDLSGHIEYKLRLPAHPSVDRLARLTSQLKWRLLEGGGEAMYELGVCDNGLLLGIGIDEIDASITTLRRMADGLGATVKIARRMQISTEGVKEVQSDEDTAMSETCAVGEKPAVSYRPPLYDCDSAVQRPLPYIHKRRLTKKDRRQVKREREQWLEVCTEESASTDNVVFGTAGNSTISHEEVSRSICLQYATATTPPADEIPGLSHSPSPPSSAAGDQFNMVQQASGVPAIYSAHRHTMPSSLNSSIRKGEGILGFDGKWTPEKPIPVEISAAEQAQHALRRHLRKEWKKEKQHKKQVERARPLPYSPCSKLVHSYRGSSACARNSHDKYLDGLAALFGDMLVNEADDTTTRVEATHDHRYTASPAGQEAPARQDNQIAASQRRNACEASASPSTRSSVPPAKPMREDPAGPHTALQHATTHIDHRRHMVSARRPNPILPRSSATEKRYAVECLIRMPSGLTSEECTDHDEGSVQDPEGGSVEASTTLPSSQTGPGGEGLRGLAKSVESRLRVKQKKLSDKSSRSNRERNQLQSFIDFETVWDELEMNLS